MTNHEAHNRQYWFYRHDDSIVYVAAGVYSVPFVVWFIRVILELCELRGGIGSGLFESFPLYGFKIPFMGFSLLIVMQLLTIFRFSLLANTVAVGTIFFWICVVCYIVGRIAASV